MVVSSLSPSPRPRRTLMLCCLFLAVAFLAGAKAEIETVSITLPASAFTIEVEENFLSGPGFVDLSGLTFTPDRSGSSTSGNTSTNSSLLSTVDIAVVKLDEQDVGKSDCNKKLDCAGVGIATETKGRSIFCCTKGAIQRGKCEAISFGRLIYQDDVFKGHKRSFQVPAKTSSIQLDDGKIKLYGSGLYALVFANCNEKQGMPVEMKGKIVWKSAHGYMYGDLFGVFDGFIFLFCLYLALVLWYGREMYLHHYQNMNNRVPAEEWILGTILLGLGSIFFDWVHFALLNRTGYNWYSLRATSIFLGSFEQAAARCVALLLALGEGGGSSTHNNSFLTLRDPNATTRPVVRFGLLYVTLSIVLDCSVTFLVQQFKTHTIAEEAGVIEFSGILFVILIVLDMFCFVWMMRAVNRTIEFCASNNQRPEALERYQSLRNVFRGALVFTLFLVCLSFIHKSPEASRRYHWVLDVLDETAYLAFFAVIAFLWRPRPDAKDCYAPLTAEALAPEEPSDLYLELTDSAGSAIAPASGMIPGGEGGGGAAPPPPAPAPEPGTIHNSTISMASSLPLQVESGGPWMNSTPNQNLL